MAADREHEIRQLLKAYRKGLITDELFAEQMRELGADGRDRAAAVTPPKTYTYDGATLTSEQQLVRRFLDDFRAAESFGGEVLALWAEVASEPVVRGGLRTICTRERSHGELLARRLQELGGECVADLSPNLKLAARERLASADVSDLEKLRDFVARYPDVDAAVKPIRDVIMQLEQDLETKALLSTILDDEVATLRWMAATFKMLATANAPGGLPSP